MANGIKIIRWMAVASALLIFCACQERAAAQTGALIFVTSLEDKISSTGGCSLQEAIYSANLNNNIAPDSLNDDASEHLITTQCVPGSPDGTDILVLPAGAVFLMDRPTLDIHNPFGPTATPPVTSRIRIEANGSRFQHSGTQNFRAFAVASTGDLTISAAYISGFTARGGDAGFSDVSGNFIGGGGGGGMGAGGALYVKGSGRLVIENSTFEGNGAIGGNGSAAGTSSVTGAGGGGGMGGNGFVDPFGAAGSPGGGSGSDGSRIGGGGTIPIAIPLTSANFDAIFPLFCGGRNGGAGVAGEDGLCPGGGGGGGGHVKTDNVDLACLPVIGGEPAKKGGNGNYGGGGGGGGSCENGSGANGGDGGFGGGGGTAIGSCDSGGHGGFGGGGGTCAGHPGTGGKFGGDANAHNGGGGGALGGAIFSDEGAVTVRNSTFTGNFAVRGLGGSAGTPGAADNGADAGGAIYSWKGSLEIQNSTISGNEGTGSLAGVAVSGTTFVLNNTIISDNGTRACGVDTGSTVSGIGNLIQENVDCPGVVSIDDPQLSALDINNGGPTPTMAISRTSPAIDAADRGTSLQLDQRGTERPQPLDGGFDIGAYERCPLRHFGPILTEECQNDIITTTPETWPLTMISSPAQGGVLTPAAGINVEPKNVVVLISAAPNPGFVFNGWTGNVTDPFLSTTTVVMDQPQTVTANFTSLFATMAGNIIAKNGPTNARVWTLSLLDNGPAVTSGVQILSFTLMPVGGRACTPAINTAFPLSIGTIGVGQTGTANVTIDFSSCAPASRFTAAFTYSANGGFVSGSVVRTNQFQ